MTPQPVLLSWVAVENDPYQRDRDTRKPVLLGGKPVPGPTLTVLFDPDSPFADKIKDVVLLHRRSAGATEDRERKAVEETIGVLRKIAPQLRIHLESWTGEDPTDHRSIFEFLRDKIPKIRRRFAGREMVIHISPGTPSMQTIWVLMAETGFIEPPFQVVKSYRKAERRGRAPVVAVDVGIETFYKAYKASRPSQLASEEQAILLDPARFRTERMRSVFSEARRFGHMNVPVLILGERGTGKTTLAGWIRLNSPFRREDQDYSWPSVACGQYSAETMRAELFGYKKGSFTGATKDRDGLLSAADGDTLFLDEVGDVSRDLQRLLIKALEEKKYLPLGDDRPRKSDFRLLAATNLNDEELRQRLDPDFLDRISLLKLRLPPLRETAEELPWVWESTYEQAAKRAGVSAGGARLGAMHHRRVVAALERHPLPGNLRDLFRIAYRILSARSDPHSPLSPEDAVHYGLAALEEGASESLGGLNVSRAVAAAFAESRPLDGIIDSVGCMPTNDILRDFKTFMADELRRLARMRGLSVKGFCDVSDRALRSWTSSSGGEQISSAKRKNSSGTK